MIVFFCKRKRFQLKNLNYLQPKNKQMKKLFISQQSNKTRIARRQLSLKDFLPLMSLAILFIAVALGCNKQPAEAKIKNAVIQRDSLALTTDNDFLNAYKKPNEDTDSKIAANHESSWPSWAAFLELLQARLATAKYLSFDKAIAEHYVDINVVIPHMGYHYLKSEIRDNKFEITKPELLVYNKTANGKMQLSALEYAVPINLSPNEPPAGFTGNTDVWKYDTTFQLWTLHAWVWRFNPEGVFSPMNSLVP